METDFENKTDGLLEAQNENEIEQPTVEPIAEDAPGDTVKAVLEALADDRLRSTLAEIFAPKPMPVPMPMPAKPQVPDVRGKVSDFLSEIDGENPDNSDMVEKSQAVVEQILENPEGDEWKIVIAKGIAYDNAVNRAYIKGRNEQIEVIRKITNVPLDDFERIQALKHRDSDFLANPRRSVWDI
ncbi:MAG: hypothetical protein PUC21_01585 [Bacteroidales bacterium]|nr:hypothetical protein [Bacteroidales bacterium]